MATKISFPPLITVHQSSPLRKTFFGMAKFRKSQLPIKRMAKLQIRSSIRNQVFEDHAAGIICYEDDRGEIVCEGFDEGPRLLEPHPPTTYPSRHVYFEDADILDRLQQRWLQIIDGQSTNGAALQEEHRCNGFNALH